MTGRVEVVRHNRVDLALHHLRVGQTAVQPLLLLHGLGEAAPKECPGWLASWPGSVVALDFTGHGASTIPRGGGYTAEMLLGDADAALAALTVQPERSSITVVGRGLGAYIALQLAGARPTQIHGAILLDGPGLAGGATEPTSLSYFSLPSTRRPPDPYALVELGRDLRPADYATSFVRLALAGSSLAEPIAVCSIFRPTWLDAVAREGGVMDVTVTEALAAYAGDIGI